MDFPHTNLNDLLEFLLKEKMNSKELTDLLTRTTDKKYWFSTEVTWKKEILDFQKILLWISENHPDKMEKQNDHLLDALNSIQKAIALRDNSPPKPQLFIKEKHYSKPKIKNPIDIIVTTKLLKNNNVLVEWKPKYKQFSSDEQYFSVFKNNQQIFETNDYSFEDNQLNPGNVVVYEVISSTKQKKKKFSSTIQLPFKIHNSPDAKFTTFEINEPLISGKKCTGILTLRNKNNQICFSPSNFKIDGNFGSENINFEAVSKGKMMFTFIPRNDDFLNIKINSTNIVGIPKNLNVKSGGIHLSNLKFLSTEKIIQNSKSVQKIGVFDEMGNRITDSELIVKGKFTNSTETSNLFFKYNVDGTYESNFITKHSGEGTFTIFDSFNNKIDLDVFVHPEKKLSVGVIGDKTPRGFVKIFQQMCDGESIKTEIIQISLEDNQIVDVVLFFNVAPFSLNQDQYYDELQYRIKKKSSTESCIFISLLGCTADDVYKQYWGSQKIFEKIPNFPSGIQLNSEKSKRRAIYFAVHAGELDMEEYEFENNDQMKLLIEMLNLIEK
eukprot:gene3565-6300_t